MKNSTRESQLEQTLSEAELAQIVGGADPPGTQRNEDGQLVGPVFNGYGPPNPNDPRTLTFF